MISPLRALTVVEAQSPDCTIGEALAVSFCTRIAASLGAKVLRETPGGSDVTDIPEALSAFLHFGKAERPESGALKDDAPLMALVANRTFVDALPPGDLPAIAVAIGSTAEVRDRPSSEFTLMARSGVLDLIGEAGRTPLPLPGHQPAYAAGLAAYAGLAAAMVRLGRSGGNSERVDVTILDTLLWLNWKSVLSSAWGRPSPTRQGRLGEWPMLRCADGWMACVYRDVDWPALKTLVGDPRLEDERFATRAGRESSRSALFDIIEAAFLRQTRAELTAAAMAFRIPLGPVLDPAELRDDDHYGSRDVFENIKLQDGSVAVLPRLPVKWLSEQPNPGICQEHGA